MLILIYEYLTGGGTFSEPGSPHPRGSLLCEGSAMLQAVATDFQAMQDVELVLLRDGRLHPVDLPRSNVIEIGTAVQEQAAIKDWASLADYTLLIAPETGGALEQRCLLVEDAGGRLLGPDSQFVSIASDKQRTAELLNAAGVPIAETVVHDDEEPLFATVLKPRCGAGSQDVRLLNQGQRLPDEYRGNQWRRERFYPGQPASVAVLCGAGGVFPLEPCRQRLSDDGRFRYLGGSLPLPPNLAERAQRLAVSAVEAMGIGRGYIGVDLVLGESDCGVGDVVIEVNPRLTTSYVGLRAAAIGNLAASMLAAAGGEAPALSFDRNPLEFTADGNVDHQT